MESHTDTAPLHNITIPRRSRSKVLEVVPELAAAIDAKTGKPRKGRGGQKVMVPTGRWRLNGYYLAGKRVVRIYATESAAKADLERLKIEHGNVDAKTRHALASRNDLVQDAIRAEALVKPFGLTLLESAKEHAAVLSALEPYGLSLRDMVAHYVQTAAARDKSITLGELVQKFLKDRERLEMSAAYLRDLRNRLRRFEEHFGSNTMTSDIEKEEIDQWLSSLALSPTSTNNFRRNTAVMFGFAVDCKHISENPFSKVKQIKVKTAPPAIFTPAQVRKLLDAAPPEMVPFLAIAFFAGLRPESELGRMSWDQVKFQSGQIEVTGNNKTSSRRLVKMSDNLRAWLAPFQGMKGQVMPPNHRKLRVATMQAAKVTEWPQDVSRHSFASYHLAKSQNAAETALQLGHKTTKMLFQHYRELVEPAAAEKYWDIQPTATAGNVVPFSRSA